MAGHHSENRAASAGLSIDQIYSQRLQDHLPTLPNLLLPAAPAGTESEQRAALLEISYADCYRPVTEFLTTEELRGLEPIIKLRTQLNQQLWIDHDPYNELCPQTSVQRKLLPFHSIENRCRRLAAIGELVIDGFLRAPSALSYAALLEVHEFTRPQTIFLSMRSHGQKHASRFRELHTLIDELYERSRKLIEHPLARDYIIDAMAVAPDVRCRRYLCEVCSTLTGTVEAFVEALTAHAITPLNLRSIRRLVAFGMHLSGIGEIEYKDLHRDELPHGLNIGCSLIRSVLLSSRNLDRPLLGDPSVRTAILPLLERLREQIIGESRIPLESALSRFKYALEDRGRVIIRAFPDEIESFRQEALGRGVPWGVLEPMLQGLGLATFNQETARVAAKPLVLLAEFFYNKTCRDADAEPSDESFAEELLMVAHASARSRNLHDIYRRFHHMFLNDNSAFRLLSREFLRHASPPALCVWRTIMTRHSGGAFWGIADFSRHEIPEQSVIGYVQEASAYEATQVMGKLYEQYSDAECAHLVQLAAAEPAALKALAALSPPDGYLWDRLLSVREVTQASDLPSLVSLLTKRYLDRLQDGISACSSAMSKTIESAALDHDESRYCWECAGDFREKLLAAIDQLHFGRLELDTANLPLLLRQQNFAMLNAGLFDLSAALPPTGQAISQIADARNLLHDLFPRGLFASIDRTEGESSLRVEARRAVRDCLAATAGMIIGWGTGSGEAFFEAMRNDADLRERFFTLLRTEEFATGALRMILEENGTQIPDTTFEVLAKSAVRSWASLELSDNQTAVLEITHAGEARAACSLRFFPDGTLCITSTALPPPLQRDKLRCRAALRDFLQRYCRGEISTLTPAGTARRFQESVRRVTIYDHNAAFPCSDLPLIGPPLPGYPKQWLLFEHSPPGRA